MQPESGFERLVHTQDSIHRTFRHVEGMDYEGFSTDEKTIDVVIKCLLIIGEAARNVPQDMRASNPEVPWQDIIGMRNRLIHVYFEMDLGIVWQTVSEDLLLLEDAVQKLIDSTSSSE